MRQTRLLVVGLSVLFLSATTTAVAQAHQPKSRSGCTKHIHKARKRPVTHWHCPRKPQRSVESQPQERAPRPERASRSGTRSEPVVVHHEPEDMRGRVLFCIRSYEQGAAGYRTNTGNGYSGAYQYDPGTWRGGARRAGYEEWANVAAYEAPPEVQDAVTWFLWQAGESRRWPTPHKHCHAPNPRPKPSKK